MIGLTVHRTVGRCSRSLQNLQNHGAGSKIGFDATAKWAEEGKVRVWPKELQMDAATKDLVERRWREYGL